MLLNVHVEKNVQWDGRFACHEEKDAINMESSTRLANHYSHSINQVSSSSQIAPLLDAALTSIFYL